MAKASSKASSTDSDDRRLTAKGSASATSAGQASRGGEPTRKKLTRKRFETKLLELQRELVIMQEYVKTKGAEDRRDLRGARRRRQGRRDQAHHRADEPARLPRRRAARADRARDRRSGTSSATCRTCPPPARSCCSTAPGTTAPASSG